MKLFHEITEQLFCYKILHSKVLFGELNGSQEKKLKQLTIVSLASKIKGLPYSLLMEQLEIETVRQLEDMVLDTFYQGLVQGKLDQSNKIVQIDTVAGRDVRRNDLEGMNDKLLQWSERSKKVLSTIDQQIHAAQSRFKENLTEILLFQEQVQKRTEEVMKAVAEKGGLNEENAVGGRRNRKRNPLSPSCCLQNKNF